MFYAILFMGLFPLHSATIYPNCFEIDSFKNPKKEERMYEIVYTSRKTLAIQIYPDGRVVVRAPVGMPKGDIVRFVDKKASWIEKHLTAIGQQMPSEPAFTAAELKALADRAATDITERVERFAPLIGVTCCKITIRAQRSRWGSCSAKGNLNFNCLLMLCPEEVRDYVVVHELCHCKELNHSPAFWQEVSAVLPQYAAPRKWLKANGHSLIRRLG